MEISHHKKLKWVIKLDSASLSHTSRRSATIATSSFLRFASETLLAFLACEKTDGGKVLYVDEASEV